MTDSDSKSQAAPLIKDPSEKAPSKHQRARRSTHLKTTYRLLLLLIIGITLVGIAYYVIRLNVRMEQQTRYVVAELARFKQQQTHVDTLTKERSDSHAELQHQLKTLDNHVNTILQQRMNQTNDWSSLLTIRYYFELAQINEQWSDNTDTSIALLQQADTLLSRLHDDRALPIRQQVAKNIALLKARPTIDKVGLLSQLDAALDVVAHLPLNAMTHQMGNQGVEKTMVQEPTSTWRKRFNQSIDALKTLVVIRHHEDTVEPLPSPANEIMWRERLSLTLQEAIWAILEHDESVYQSALTKAIAQVKHLFSTSTPATTALLKQLADLQNTLIVQKKISFSSPLSLLTLWIESTDPKESPQEPSKESPKESPSETTPPVAIPNTVHTAPHGEEL